MLQQVGYEARDFGDFPRTGVGYMEARIRMTLHLPGEGLSDRRWIAFVRGCHFRVRGAVGELDTGSAVTVRTANGVHAEILLVGPMSWDGDKRPGW